MDDVEEADEAVDDARRQLRGLWRRRWSAVEVAAGVRRRRIRSAIVTPSSLSEEFDGGDEAPDSDDASKSNDKSSLLSLPALENVDSSRPIAL